MTPPPTSRPASGPGASTLQPAPGPAAPQHEAPRAALGKKALSQYLRTNCLRQLRLNLTPLRKDSPERDRQEMPDKQPPRPGLQLLKEAGDEYQEAVIADLTNTFPSQALIGAPPRGATALSYGKIALAAALATVGQRGPGEYFLVEAEYEITPPFERAVGFTPFRREFQLAYNKVRPDLIQVTPPGRFASRVTPRGDRVALAAGDARIQLRVIDVKLTAEPSPSYFAEIAYYMMALAAWLEHHRMDDRFVVVADGAVWPGSHAASKLRQGVERARREVREPTADELFTLVVADVVVLPLEVFAPRVRRFLLEDVPRALREPDWRDLPWGVDTNCKGCDYLGLEWRRKPSPGAPVPPDPTKANLCVPAAAATDHLSRVAFMTRGSRAALSDESIASVADLAARSPDDPAFSAHHTLRATRTVVAARAQALQTQLGVVDDASGTSAVMPRWTDLRIYASVDFDLGSAITLAFGLKAFWIEPLPPTPRGAPRLSPTDFATVDVGLEDLALELEESTTGEEIGGAGADAPPADHTSDVPTAGAGVPGGVGQAPGARLPTRKKFALTPTVWVNEDKSVDRERDLLLAFLNRLHGLLSRAREQDAASTVQVYLWDDVQYTHLVRIIGRHLEAIRADQKLGYLAWLFPPETVLPNPDLATRMSPVTIVRDAVRAHVSVPVPHYYSLLNTARAFHPRWRTPENARFHVHPLFEDPLSDQIPAERAHAIWSRYPGDKKTGRFAWDQQKEELEKAVRQRLIALEAVQKRLEADLRPSLQHTAPRIVDLGSPVPAGSLSRDGQLWYAFAKLNAALDALEVQQIRAMPPHEREARFKSARLTRRLPERDERAALARLGLARKPGRRVYELHEDSCEVKAAEGDFQFALGPRADAGFLERKLHRLAPALADSLPQNLRYGVMERLTKVTVVQIDRDGRQIVLDHSPAYLGPSLEALERAGIDLSREVMMDPTYSDHFTEKLLATLKAIDNPVVANAKAMVPASSGVWTRRPVQRKKATGPVAEFLWGAKPQMHAVPVERDLAAIRPALQRRGFDLNPSQWAAWETALTRRLSVIWGPPGTGKSQTARAIILGAVLDAQRAGRPLRVLICGATYSALDNVLLAVYEGLPAIAPEAPAGSAPARVGRIRSSFRPEDPNVPPEIDVAFDTYKPSDDLLAWHAELRAPTGVTVIGTTQTQVHHLLKVGGAEPQQPFFDLILIDEASQMDVGEAILALAALAPGGAVVLAGDPTQLPPIHAAEAPKGLEALVGSVYRFVTQQHEVPAEPLLENYRSNETIVAFAREFAGYPPALRSAAGNANRLLTLTTPMPRVRPADWPATLPWSDAWADLLSPEEPVGCFVYEDGRSSQSNVFEADAVTAMACLLAGRVPFVPKPRKRGKAYPDAPAVVDFWENVVGVVTPHKAQQALVVRRLREAFPDVSAGLIRSAVDTVERFQGQEREVMLASYALGDPDAIGSEDEFLLGLNRFNVTTSRPRSKLVLLVSQEVVNHLCGDMTALRESGLLKAYVDSYCNEERSLVLPSRDRHRAAVSGTFRFRRA